MRPGVSGKWHSAARAGYALQFVLFGAINVTYLSIWAVRWRSVFWCIKYAYNFNTLVLPLSLVLAGALGFAASKRGAAGCRAAALACFAAAGLLVCARLWATVAEPRMLMLRRAELRSPKVRKPLRILHITDVQSSLIGNYEEKAFARMRALNPDLVIHTGDMLHPIPPATVQSELPKLAELFAGLHPPLGKWNVMGDVDHPFMGALREGVGGMTTLFSGETTISLEGGGRVRLLGLSANESHFPAFGKERVAAWLKAGEPGDFTIVAGHAPDYVLALEGLPIDLCLAGHTHGGQVRIPFYGPLLTLSQVPREWARGFRKAGKTALNVSAGVGCEHTECLMPIRVNCPSEMTLIEVSP